MAGFFWIILACAFWALDTLVRYPLVEKGINPTAIVFIEHTVLMLIFSLRLIPGYKGFSRLTMAHFWGFLVIGAIGSGLSTVAFTKAFYYLNPSLVILLQKFQPVMAIFLAYFILKEPIDKGFLLLAGFCLLGAWLISGPDVVRFFELIHQDPGKVVSDQAVKGYLLVIASIVGWSATTVYGKYLSNNGFTQTQIMGGRFFLGWLVLLPFILEFPNRLLLTDGFDYVRILVMVLLSGAAAMWFYYKGLSKVSARTCAVLEMFFPLFAVVVNWLFLGKQLTDVQIAGGIMLVIGSLIIQIKKY